MVAVSRIACTETYYAARKAMKFYTLKNGAVFRSGDIAEFTYDNLILDDGEVKYAGEAPPPPPPPEPTLAERKLIKWREIKATATRAGISGFTAGGFNWDSDLATQQAMQLTWQDMKEADGPTTVQWYDANGTTRNLTASQFKNLCRALRTHLETQRTKAATLRAQINAATTQAELDAITW
jgi:hypothetical protein